MRTGRSIGSCSNRMMAFSGSWYLRCRWCSGLSVDFPLWQFRRRSWTRQGRLRFASLRQGGSAWVRVMWQDTLCRCAAQILLAGCSSSLPLSLPSSNVFLERFERASELLPVDCSSKAAPLSSSGWRLQCTKIGTSLSIVDTMGLCGRFVFSLPILSLSSMCSSIDLSPVSTAARSEPKTVSESCVSVVRIFSFSCRLGLVDGCSQAKPSSGPFRGPFPWPPSSPLADSFNELLSTTNSTTRSRASCGTAPTDFILMLVFGQGSIVPEWVRGSCRETVFYRCLAVRRQSFTVSNNAGDIRYRIDFSLVCNDRVDDKYTSKLCTGRNECVSGSRRKDNQ